MDPRPKLGATGVMVRKPSSCGKTSQKDQMENFSSDMVNKQARDNMSPEVKSHNGDVEAKRRSKLAAREARRKYSD